MNETKSIGHNDREEKTNGAKRDGAKRSGLGVDSVPNRGIASETCGRVSATRLRNTVSDRRIVTPAIKHNVNTPTSPDPTKYTTLLISSYTSRALYNING